METGAFGVTAALLVAVVVLSISWAVKRKHQQRLFQRYGIPGPVPDFLFGNWNQLREDRIEVMEKWIKEYGKVFGFYEGEIPKVVISDLNMIKECFVKETHVFRDRMPLIIEVEPIKSSLLALRGEEWKRVRSVLNPAFSGAKMKLMLQVMNDCGNTLIDVISERLTSGQDIIDVTNRSQALSMDVITKCALAWQLLLDSRTEAAQKGSGKVEITDRHLIANCFVFLAGGFETTATTLAFLLYELARHPEEQDRLYEEIKSQLADHSVNIPYDDVQKLKRMDMVVSECLRLYPPIVLFTARVCSRDTSIAGYTVPAGTHVILPTWHVHHNPNIWPEPQKFIPDRFLLGIGEEERRHAAAYVPFGLGHRECIGRRFALLELKTVLAKLIRAYVFSVCRETDDPMKVTVPTVTLNPVRNIKLRVTRRNT
ncbi:hypothetical protein HPB50_004416 [Hyalomma asiaticum]|uniref:Uncharacterized protein n=1 Tax=Hyalomma asiaticum TaxID=266040 RepID=A0ACB7TER3_HYAAI|nr:hypothetical protein HPB50_004416 [Hyalomma asiaticum]